MPHSTMVGMEIFKDDRIADQLDPHANFLFEFTDQRVLPRFPEFDGSSKWANTFKCSIIPIDLACEQTAIPPMQAQCFYANG